MLIFWLLCNLRATVFSPTLILRVWATCGTPRPCVVSLFLVLNGSPYAPYLDKQARQRWTMGRSNTIKVRVIMSTLKIDSCFIHREAWWHNAGSFCSRVRYVPLTTPPTRRCINVYRRSRDNAITLQWFSAQIDFPWRSLLTIHLALFVLLSVKTSFAFRFRLLQHDLLSFYLFERNGFIGPSELNSD